MIEPARFAAYIASSICHDLISPVGSINSALELLEDPGDAEMKAQAQQLLENGAESAAARVQLLRYAFGSAGLSDSAADRHEVRKIIDDYIKGHKPSLDWHIETEHLSYSHARVLMNLVILAVGAIPRGGVVTVTAENTAKGLTVSASGAGPRARLSPQADAAIKGGEPEDGWSARTIQPLFTAMVIADLGGKFAATVAEEKVTFEAIDLRAGG
ncbi:MAG: histidine phosphotransferase family protein [Pseudomonadota bacterium]